MFQELLKALPDVLSDYAPFAKNGRVDRGTLPAKIAASLIAEGERLHGQPYPFLPITAYMDFLRTGNRVRFEGLYFKRRDLLGTFVLAELAEGKGRFLDDVIDGVYALCEESGWQLPAHNSYLRDTPQLLLPDTARPVLDLFACETGALLALTRYLLRDALDAVSPAVCARILRELETRIVAPYLHEHFWWMGNGGEPMCNWTPWCTQNVLLTVFLTGQPQDIKRKTVEQAAYSLDCFLKDYGEDGCCNEGVGYYHHAGLCLWGAMEVLNAAAADAFAPLYRQPQIRNIAEYVLNMHVHDRYYFNFSDCSPINERAGAREFLFGRRVRSDAMMAYAARDSLAEENEPDPTDAPDLPNKISLFNRALTAFTAGEMAAYRPAGAFHPRDLYYPSVGIFVARDTAFALAVKAGCNADSHNHNDTGSVTLYKNGRPFLIDVGVESYTKKTFSPQRYEIWTMQSAYHNLPTFSGVTQKDGAAYAARDVQTSFDDAESTIALDIASAYPPEAGVKQYLRAVTLEKGHEVRIEDTFEGSIPPELSLMLCEQPVVEGGTIRVGTLGEIRFHGGTCAGIDKLPISDPRLRATWPDTLWRVRIAFAERLTLIIR